MKALELAAPKQFRALEIDEPNEPGPGQALIRTSRMGICGTDVSCYLGKFPFFDSPRIPGHELGVEVLAVGEEVANVKPGDHCSVEPYLNCGGCHACRKGYGNCCENLKVFGVMMNGGLCERSVIRADKLHPAERLSFEQLALVETLAIGCHATRPPTDRVVSTMFLDPDGTRPPFVPPALVARRSPSRGAPPDSRKLRSDPPRASCRRPSLALGRFGLLTYGRFSRRRSTLPTTGCGIPSHRLQRRGHSSG